MTRQVFLAVTVVLLIVLVALSVYEGAAHHSRLSCFGRQITIRGTNGADVIIGTSEPDVIAALAGNDSIFGVGGTDRICAGKGRDRIDGGDGYDWGKGARGRDTCVNVEVKRSCED